MRLLHTIDELKAVLGTPFSDEQVAAIVAPPDAPGVIIAGAGSGKTTVMAARVVWLVGHDAVEPAEILGLTFTNKAASGLAAKIREALTRLAADSGIAQFLEEKGEPTVGTYHSFAGQLVSEHGLRIGLETDLRLSTDASRYQRAVRAVRNYGGRLDHVSADLTTVVGQVIRLDGELNDHLVSTERLRAEEKAIITEANKAARLTKDVNNAITAAERRYELSLLVDAYREAKRDDGVADHSDVMAGGARLAIESSEVQRVLRERFSAVLLDEYQDTSYGQRRMLQALFSGPDNESGRGHAVTAVGDPAQGIYGWRGAAGDSLTRFSEHFPRADGSPSRTYSLVVCRRCDSHILELANTVAAEFYAQSSVVKPLQPAPGAEPGRISVARHLTVDDEIEALADAVAARGGPADDRPVHWSDIAVLVRNWNEVEGLTAALRSRGVPAEILGLSGLLHQPEVSDVLAVLNVAADSVANASLMRLLTGVRWRIGPRDLALLGQRAKQLASGPEADLGDDVAQKLHAAVSGADPSEVISLLDAVEDLGSAPFSSQARSRFAEISSLLRSARRHVSQPVVDQIHRVVRLLGLDIELGITENGRQGRDNLAALVEVAAAFEANAEAPTLDGFLAYLKAEEEFGSGLGIDSPSETDSVKVLTIHKAKGLEWEVVYVPFLARGIFPSTQGRPRWTSRTEGFPVSVRGDSEVLPELAEWSNKGLKAFADAWRALDQSEELRLAYVAFTRAAHELHLSGHWWSRSTKTPRAPSPYLDSAYDWVVAHGHQVREWIDAPDPEAGDIDNPLSVVEPVAWPAAGPTLAGRHEAVRLVADALDGSLQVPEPLGTEEEAAELAQLEVLDGEIERLRAEAEQAASAQVEVALPQKLSATTLIGLQDETARESFARALYRPMPRKPVAAARLGTRFHAWVEDWYGQHALLEPEEVAAARSDDDIATEERDLAQLVAMFKAGPYASRTPVAIEPAFSFLIGGQLVHGRIDAVFAAEDGFEVVDWKTNRASTSDRLQLAIYRLAWAAQHDVDPEHVTGSFYYVARDEVVTYNDLPGHEELSRLLPR